MTYRRIRRGRRPAFTLIELLVVIAIIAILVSLLAAAVMRALSTGPQGQTRAEIGNMDTALQSMMGTKKLTYLPSRLHLSKLNNYGNTQLDLDSKAYLQQRFGRDCCYGFQALSANGPFIDWNGDGNRNEELYLEGEQCLVFHLGGVPVTSNGLIKMVGFSQNISNPALAPQTQGERRDGPFYELQTARLKAVTSGLTTALAGNGGGAFPVYIDIWNNAKTPQPYAFFSAYTQTGTGNYWKYSGGPNANVNDCLSLGVAPYYTSTPPTTATTLFSSPNSWQIISAGSNGAFGPGGLWNPSQGVGTGVGSDDQANFSQRPLGAAAN